MRDLSTAPSWKQFSKKRNTIMTWESVSSFKIMQNSYVWMLYQFFLTFDPIFYSQCSSETFLGARPIRIAISHPQEQWQDGTVNGFAGGGEG